MEDATKALLIAAGVLIGLMIVSLGITLGQSLSQYSDNAQKQIEENALQNFNTQFTKYINCDSLADTNTKFDLTIHDIITVANIAYENNFDYNLSSAENFNYYVTVNMSGKNNLERTISSSTEIENLLKNKSEKKYKCSYNNITVNTNTGRVCEITFIEI